MKKIMTIIFALVIFTVFALGMMELVAVSVYGPWLRDAEVSTFLGKHLDKYTYNDYSLENGKRMFFHMELPYIAENASVLGGWHIEGHGIIPRWSPHHAVLERQFALVSKDFKRKTLSDI